MRLGRGIAITLFLLLVAEVGLRLFAPDISLVVRLFEPTQDPRPFVLKPGVRVEYAGIGSSLGRTVLWEINEQGLREDHRIGPPAGRFRVLTYGDSEAFGWSVELEETFQRRMQAIDGRAEVINLGVPGYNAANSREHLERTLEAFDPDLAIFLVTRNDLEPSLAIHTIWSRARILMWARLLYQLEFEEPERKVVRESPERKQHFADEVDRMIRFCERRGVPLIVAFTRWETRRDLLDHLGPDSWLATHRPGLGTDGFGVALVDVEAATHGLPQVDDHYSAAAHQALAALFCGQISGAPQGDQCVPADWAPRQPTQMVTHHGARAPDGPP
jgi:hypothetical protein